MSYLFYIHAVVLFIQLPAMALGQSQLVPVRWSFSLSTPNMREAVLNAEATIAPGWHVYSQSQQPGGPIPTRFTFAKPQEFVPLSNMVERGNAVRYYDELYEMDITWYADAVSYSQTLLVNQPAAALKGVVEYMACNEYMCIPIEEKFTVELKQITKK